MKKVRKPLPRPAKVALQLLALVLIVLLIYFALGSPPLSVKMGFRRAERAHMVGPGRILAEFQQTSVSDGGGIVVNVSDSDPLTYIIADTEDSYILYYDNRTFNYDRFYNYTKGAELVNSSLFACKKTGEMTLLHLPHTFLPTELVLFDLEPRAVRAELEVALEYWHHDTSFTEVFSAEAQRLYPGFFIFSFSKPDGASDQWYSAASRLRELCSAYGTGKPAVTIRLYDTDNNLIRAEAVTPGPSL